MASVCCDYNPDQVVIKIGEKTIFAWDDVTVEQNDPNWVLTKSTNGKVSFRHQPAGDGTLTLTMSQESVHNGDLLYLRQLHASGKSFPFSVTDRSCPSDTVSGECARIEQMPSLSRSDDDPSYEVTILATHLIWAPTTGAIAASLQDMLGDAVGVG